MYSDGTLMTVDCSRFVLSSFGLLHSPMSYQCLLELSEAILKNVLNCRKVRRRRRKRTTRRDSSDRHLHCPAVAAFSVSVESAFADVQTTIHFLTLRVALAGTAGHVHWAILLLSLMALLLLPASRRLL